MIISRFRQKIDETNVLLYKNSQNGIQSDSRKAVVVHIPIIITSSFDSTVTENVHAIFMWKADCQFYVNKNSKFFGEACSFCKGCEINQTKIPEGSLTNIGLLKHIKVIKELFNMAITLETYAQGDLDSAFELRWVYDVSCMV